MRVLFISANTEKMNILPMPLGLNYVAAATKNKGHEVKVLDLMFHADPPLKTRETIDSFRPEVIGVSVRNIDDQSMNATRFLLDDVKTVVHYCRSLSDAPVVLGGAGYSIFPEAVLAWLDADMGIQGEGEAAFPQLLERLERHADPAGLPGLYLKDRRTSVERSFIRDLKDLDVSGVHCFSSAYDRSLWMPFQTRRGCPMDCSYCSTATIEGRTIRKRPPEPAIEELKGFVKAGFKRIHFVDNTFNLPSSYAKEICRRIIDAGLEIDWMAILYPAKIDEELVRLMAASGCRGVSLGFESGCERMLKAMNKRFTPEEVRKASLLFAEHDIRQMGFLMLGGPGETRESVLESFAFADTLPLDSLKISQGIRIYPYTALAKIAVAEGRIASDDNLLSPVFYMVRELEDWLRDAVKDRMAERPHWQV